MALSDTYTTGVKWKCPSSYNLAFVCSKTFDELFGNSQDFDASILFCNGSTSQYLNYGAYGKDGFMKKAMTNGTMVDGSAGQAIQYLGACIIFNDGTADREYINLTHKAVNTYDPYYIGDWNDVKNFRFVIDICNPNLFGGAPTSAWGDFDYATRKNSCYHFGGAYLALNYIYGTASGAGNETTTGDVTSITGDNRKRIFWTAPEVHLSNYSPTMGDSESLSDNGATIMYAFNAGGEIFLVNHPDNVPLHNVRSSQAKQFVQIGADNYYLTIGQTSNSNNTSMLPVNDESWGMYIYGGWEGSRWRDDWSNYFKTVNCVQYICNSSGFRWLDKALKPANAGQFRSYVRLGVMDENGIVKHNQWLVGESAIQSSDNPNKGGTYDSIPARGGGGGGSDEDEDTAISTAGAPYAKGLVNYYAMTAGSVLIDHISEALSTWDLQNTGKDLYKNLVSCKLIKPPAAIPTTGSEPFTIYGEKPQYEGADITLPVVSGNPDASFGPYSISRKFNDFRDYAPYTRVSIYLPYCGWCDLPSHVVGRSVTVKYFTDIIAATVRAVVFCGNNIVAEAAGVMGLDIPFTADAVGMKQAGVVSGLTAYAGGALQTAAGVASIITTKGGKGIGETLSGASKLVSAYTQTAIAFNENTTEISGKNGDGCSLSGATNIIIKIIRPKYGASSTAPFVPAGFAHAVGFVSNKQVRVGNVSGLLIADNVDTSGIAGATDAERAEIKRVLETGLIVNAAPE